MLNAFFIWALSITQGLGYTGVGILMMIESSFLPFPSEIIVPPAAYLASQGQINVFLVIIVGVLGSIAGATFNYILAAYLGRPLVYKLVASRWARWLMITPAKVERAENYFLLNANSATFLGRLMPVIRQLVSLPAGFSRMPFTRFLVLTTLGSTIWVSILAVLGYFLGANHDLLARYYKEISWIFLLLGVLWIFKHWRHSRKKLL
ncbi:DedA family protein [Candidatus Falkowbacteria bacterium]|uniref:VTT domain-containing protein n=1 Tax=Candidatus Falkowbacteria bacterium CG10_big_fil_rev_8_21_14_0_10_37_18 TaxID=1974562 RepID=A0A2H0VA03_9BACT|nr:DedA family protein [Candidatus Falkowbacteria bacterium]NCQ12805.1 DedA family protein [Candidatus Falkowbacteria bacterium]OIO06292.1 MAG: hypothetical protein AUJ26_00995 [Candidatus Falkowbacteria bacterium CG1_02_37_21]PIR95199.1 MAG: hypothetical protein COT93_03605 [Candidatus Falkowbacteria bacterium CG10_big_fil_rev_8_21_14_0_10_37_18]